MGYTHRYQFYLKKKNQVKSPSPESRVPGTGSNPPIGSDRGSGRDTSVVDTYPLTCSKSGGHFLSFLIEQHSNPLFLGYYLGWTYPRAIKYGVYDVGL